MRQARKGDLAIVIGEYRCCPPETLLGAIVNVTSDPFHCDVSLRCRDCGRLLEAQLGNINGIYHLGRRCLYPTRWLLPLDPESTKEEITTEEQIA